MEHTTHTPNTEHHDSVALLKECNAGTKMAVSSIDDILEEVADKKLKQVLLKSKDHHADLGNEIHALLLEYHKEDKEPNPMAKSMSWLKTNMKMSMEHSDATVADLITDGCNMGIKSLFKYLNQYPAADPRIRALCQKLIDIEEELRQDLRAYL